MAVIESNIAIGLGDLIYIKSALDAVKNNYEQIRLTLHDWFITLYHNDSAEYRDFINKLAGLLFSESPYILNQGSYPYRDHMALYNDYGLSPQKPELKHILCKGTPLNLGSEYFVLSTKLRYFHRDHFNEKSPHLWPLLRELSSKYKVVVLGERAVEMNAEYQQHGSNIIFGIYDEIVNNIPSERIVDLTVPALGLTSPNIEKFQQDCLILSDAKFVVTLGVGGNFCMATAVANTVGYRADDEKVANLLYDGKTYPNAIVTKDFDYFLSVLRGYL